MILCVDTSVLKEDVDHVQRDVDIADIMKHTDYFKDIEDAQKNHFLPLDFSVSVRSLYTNLVLRENVKDPVKKLYYTNITGVPEVAHKGYDLVMYVSSIGLMHNIDYSDGFNELMLKHSTFQCIGLYNPFMALVNPIIYSHVIMTDEGMEELQKYLKADRMIVPIKSIVTDGNFVPMLDTLIEIKEGESNE